MLEIPGFNILELIHRGEKTMVFKAFRIHDNTPVVLKILRASYPSPKEKSLMEHEFEIIRTLNIQGVIKAYGLSTYKNSIYLELEDFSGIPLSNLTSGGNRITLELFFKIAVKLTETLVEIHNHNIIHKDLKPQNIIYNNIYNEVKISDFGIATFFPKETQKMIVMDRVEGSLHYISPEQSGWMNRHLDYRTDFYTLGITFYELLNGYPPFRYDDPMELIHAHLAIQPQPLHEIDSQVPKALSLIILKLLKKNAEDRYKTAKGILEDIKFCRDNISNKILMENFIPGISDISNRFQISRNLFGRDNEMALIAGAIERAREDTGEILLIKGAPGIGKTSLCLEIGKYVIKNNGLYITGKFEQYRRDIPYHGFILAFNELINHILTGDSNDISIWKDKILGALGNNSDIILNLLPRLKILLGDQPGVPVLGPVESQNRFFITLQRFVLLFAKKDNPLVIFIDDLQWADASSIKLLQILATNPNNRHLVLIGAYRDDKATKNTMLGEAVRNIEDFRHNFNLYSNQKLPFQILHLKQISRDATNALLSQTINSQIEESSTLADIIWSQTAGNPFFIKQFLNSIYDDNLIIFNAKNNKWEWKLDLIRKKGATDNVVRLLTGKINRFSHVTKNILELASCIGSVFDLETLSSLNGKSIMDTRKELSEAIREEFIILHDEIAADSSNLIFEFQHDQIRYTIYSVMEKNRRIQIHRNIANLYIERLCNRLIQNESPIHIKNLASFGNYTNNILDLQSLADCLAEDLFPVVSHINATCEQITERNEIISIIGLNLLAAKKARVSAAFEASLDYLNLALKIKPPDSWKLDYFLTLAIFNEAAECEYINTDFEKSEHLCQEILENSRNILDKIKVFEIRIASFTPQNKLSEAIASGCSYLMELGIDIPHKAGKFTAIPDLVFSELKIGKNINWLESLPKMTNPEKYAAMNILVQLFTPSFISSPDLFPVLVMKLVKLSLKYGISQHSAYGLVSYGLILGSGLGRYQRGQQFGEIALKIQDKFPPGYLDCKIFFLYGNMIHHWTHPAEESQAILREAFKKGLDSGDLLFASYSLNWLNAYDFLLRKNITTTIQSMNKYKTSMENIRQKDAADFFNLWRQFIINLSLEENLSCVISGAVFDEDIAVPIWQKTNNDTDLFTYYLLKAILFYFKKEYEKALAHIELATSHKGGVFGMAVVVEHTFFYSLILSAICRHSNGRRKRKLKKKIVKNQKNLKIWAKNAPENYNPKYLIIEAELLRFNKKESCNDYYDYAIQTARKYNYILEEALANHLVADYYFSQGKSFLGKSYLKESYCLYVSWGANAIAWEIREEYPEINLEKLIAGELNPVGNDNLSVNFTETIDLKTVLKVCQNISSEIELNRLIEKLLNITMQSAGAQHGFLLLENSGKIFVAAEGRVGNVRIFKSLPLESSNFISQSIVNYVKSTNETLVLNDAINMSAFNSDPYIVRTKPKSILCLPVLKQKKLIGILYLENNLMTNVFTQRRLDVLNLICMQAIISLENAIYFDEIKRINVSFKKEIELHKKTEEALRLSQERFALAAKGANDGLWDWDLVKNEIYFSSRWKEMLGYEEADIDVYPDEWLRRIHPENLKLLMTSIDRHLDGTYPHLECEYQMMHKDGRYRWMITRGLAVRDSNGRPYRLVGSQTEITSRKLAEEQLKHDALYDILTGLPNWNLLLDRIIHAINQKQRIPDYFFCVLLIDIDRFKIINDSLGHESGNQILVHFSRILEKNLSSADTAARLGGDEYVILLENASDINEVVKVIEQIRSDLVSPFLINNHELFITISIGVVICSNDYQNAEEMLRDADTALHRAKKEGRNRYQIFDKTMHEHVISSLKLENDLRKALEKNEFRLLYQPIIDINSRKITSAEALIRWKTGGHLNLIGPEKFIMSAEENGLIIPIGTWVLREACSQMKKWLEAGLDIQSIAVNLSARQFEQKDFLIQIDSVLENSGLAPHFLNIEITENILLENTEHTIEILQGLNSRGIQTSVDDFGLGYSSLSYLQIFPVQKLKIDRSFITCIQTNPNNIEIVKAMIVMGNAMNLRVVAEGVETEEQLAILEKLKCQEIQGFFFSKPLTRDDFLIFNKNFPDFKF